jgi:hypothetical protein
MVTSNKSAHEHADIATAKEARLRDGKLALRDYQRRQSAILANMQRLRTLRLSRDSEPPSGGRASAARSQEKPSEDK